MENGIGLRYFHEYPGKPSLPLSLSPHLYPARSSSLAPSVVCPLNSFLVSADMAHAVHPNYTERHDPVLCPSIHGGMVLKHNANQRYATNAVTAFLFRELGARAGVPTQEFAVSLALFQPF